MSSVSGQWKQSAPREKSVTGRDKKFNNSTSNHINVSLQQLKDTKSKYQSNSRKVCNQKRAWLIANRKGLRHHVYHMVSVPQHCTRKHNLNILYVQCNLFQASFKLAKVQFASLCTDPAFNGKLPCWHEVRQKNFQTCTLVNNIKSSMTRTRMTDVVTCMMMEEQPSSGD